MFGILDSYVECVLEPYWYWSENKNQNLLHGSWDESVAVSCILEWNRTYNIVSYLKVVLKKNRWVNQSPHFSFQAEAREKERQKEEARKQKKLDSAFILCLQNSNIDYKLEWDEVREKLQEENAFKAITLESERIRLFKVNNAL